MSSASSNNQAAIYQGSKTISLWRKLLVSFLNKLERGKLTVTHNDGSQNSFGELHNPDCLQVTIKVNDERFYRRVLLGGSIAFGESYVENLWQTDNLTALIQLFAQNMSALDKFEQKFSWLTFPFEKISHWRNRNHLTQSKKNILAHYDLGNNLYENFLDQTMLYSSALFHHEDESLSQAQHNKVHRLLKELDLNENDHLLEIGTGWGFLALTAARHYGCKVTTTTLSDEQYQWTKTQIKKHQLEDKITLLKQDYRELTGQFDKIVSVEMIEAVGREFLAEYFKRCQTLLKPGGKIALQSITIADQRFKKYSRGVDFIQKHIFPGGFLPSVSLLSEHIAKDTNLVIRNLYDFGLDYAKTLAHWRTSFLNNFKEISEHGFDEQFKRLWLYYFAYCEAGFSEKAISVVQLTAEKPLE
jgi:cyclopropane-fatty-acyl-phospholipid synthase